MCVSRRLVSSIVILTVLWGCSPRTEISMVRIVDPDNGVSMDVPVRRNGTFSHETKRDNVVCAASGTISDDGGDVYSVELKYDRRVYSAPGKFTSEELNTTFKAKSDAEVPIGRNPSEPQSQQSDADNALANVTLRLLKHK